MTTARSHRACWALAATLLLGAGCGGTPPPFRRATRVAAERRVTAGDADLSAYFAAVYGHQRALGGVVRRRLDRLAALADALEVPENADRDTLALALREVLRREGVARVEVARGEDTPDDAVDAWYAALLDGAADEAASRAAIDARFVAVTERVTLRLRPDPTARLAPVFAAIDALLRDAEATRLCMERLAAPLAPTLQRGAELARAHGELAAEFAAAEAVVPGFYVRAMRHAQQSVRTAQWAEDALRSPEAPAPPPDGGAPATPDAQ